MIDLDDALGSHEIPRQHSSKCRLLGLGASKHAPRAAAVGFWCHVRRVVARIVSSSCWSPGSKVTAAAAAPRTTFRPNPPDAPPRTLDEALELARSEGVKWDDEEVLFRIAKSSLGAGVYATYLNLDVAQSEGRTLVLELDKLTFEGKFVVRISPDTLRSDDAIVATIAHEVHEITGLRAAFEANGGRLRADHVYSLINPRTGTLHCEAWDVADELVRRRQAQPRRRRS